MANPLSQLERVERGREAKRLLNEPLIQQALAEVDAGIIAQWRAANDVETRERLWAGLHASRRVETWLVAVREDGAMAQAEIDQQPKG